VGSLFDYYAGYTKRAPVWMRKIGLEWLFRLLIEPLRLWKRYMVGNLIFVFRIFSPVIIDMLLVSVAWISAYSLRLSIDPLFSIPIGEFRNYLYMLPLIALSWPFILSFFGLYNRKKALNQITYMADILKAVSTGLIIAVTYSYLFREAGIARSFLVIWAIVNFFILLISRSMLRLNELSSEPFIEASFHQPSLSYLIFKEFADRVAALLAIIITLPLWWFLALLIKIDSAGPAFFTQTRVGKNSRHFTVYKFRTMFKETNPNEPAPLNVKDQRITRVGRFLRRWSLDGLPQFLNVLKGDMSIVGPRPEMTFIVKDYEPWQMQRLKVKPGIAGLWQVTGRKDIPLHQNIEYDFYYINNRSFMIDLAIILKSIPAIFFKKGAY
jgi:lipopolysaccharide/colanic/teichoic acid biosynthesis glycosyltransferase